MKNFRNMFAYDEFVNTRNSKKQKLVEDFDNDIAENPLVILGRKAWFSEDDNDLRRQVERGDFLIRLEGPGYSVTVDRYDGRNNLELFKLANLGKEGSRLDPKLDELRYQDLMEDAEERILKEEEKKRTMNVICAPPAEYKHTSTEQKEEEALLFAPPYEVPANVSVPTSEKQHNVIVTLAGFVHKHGSEVLSEVAQKQKDNPLFSFLKPEHELHAYYQLVLASKEDPSVLPPVAEVRFFDVIPKIQERNQNGLAVLQGSYAEDADKIVKVCLNILVEFVKKYGDEMETKIKSKIEDNDERFVFLSPSHPLNTLYLQKLGRIPSPPPLFIPPFATPQGMVCPYSEKQHNVINTLTAFVHKHGPDVLKDVKEKQKDNPLFNFLNEDDALHSYYTLLLEAQSDPSVLKPRPEVTFFQEIPNNLTTETNGLSLLGAYSAQQSNEEEKMKEVIDILAKYVQEYGKEMETIIFSKVDDNDERFKFIAPDHDLHRYYEEKLGKSTRVSHPKEMKGDKRRILAKQLLLAEGFGVEEEKEEKEKEKEEEDEKRESDIEEEENVRTKVDEKMVVMDSMKKRSRWDMKEKLK